MTPDPLMGDCRSHKLFLFLLKLRLYKSLNTAWVMKWVIGQESWWKCWRCIRNFNGSYIFERRWWTTSTYRTSIWWANLNALKFQAVWWLSSLEMTGIIKHYLLFTGVYSDMKILYEGSTTPLDSAFNRLSKLLIGTSSNRRHFLWTYCS